MFKRCCSGKHLWLWPWQIYQRCILCGKMRSIGIGEESITLSPAGVGDVVRWSASQAALALGDLGMNKTSGKPQCWANDLANSGASNRLLLIEDDGVLIDGSNQMIGNLNMNNNRILSVPTSPTATTDAVNQSYVDSKVGGAAFYLAPAVVSGYVGNATVATLNALSAVPGDAYVVTDAGTLTRGTLAVAAGDFVQDNGTNWVKLVSNSGGYVPLGTRALINSTTALISPLTDATDDNKVAEFGGASNTPTFASGVPSVGQAIILDGATDVRANKQYVFTGSGATGSWVMSVGIQWDDLMIPVGSLYTGGGTTPFSMTWRGVLSLPTFNTGDELGFAVQIPHSYKPGTDLLVHLHWTPHSRGIAEQGRTVNWRVDLAVASINSVFSPLPPGPPLVTTYALTATCPNPGVIDQHLITAEVVVSGAGLGISSMLVGRIYRLAGDTWITNTNGNLPALLQLDFHFQQNSLGSNISTAKAY